MIKMFTGTVGSGKSYHALKSILDKLCCSKKYVISNFPVKFEKKRQRKKKERFFFVENEDLTVDFLVRMSIDKGFNKAEDTALLVIDEAGVFFNSRDWQIKPKERNQWIKFFSQSRKLGYSIILISQDMRMVDRQIRSMCEFEVKHISANNYGLFALLPFKLFFYITFWTCAKFRGSMETSVLLPWVANRYDTFGLFDLSVMAGDSPAGGGGVAGPRSSAELVPATPEEDKSEKSEPVLPPSETNEGVHQPEASADPKKLSLKSLLKKLILQKI